MKLKARQIIAAVGAFMLLFGLLCLNYTKAGGIERHARFARQRGWPEPSPQIYLLGALMSPLGSGLVGFVVGGRRRSPRLSAV